MPGTPLLMTFPLTTTSHLLADYRARGGYGALEKAMTTMQPADVTKEVTAAGILGHGGAAFPVGRKWAVIKPSDGQPHFLCANADEGEPGTFKDRWILENNPHQLIEGMVLAAWACQCDVGYIFVRGEYRRHPVDTGGVIYDGMVDPAICQRVFDIIRRGGTTSFRSGTLSKVGFSSHETPGIGFAGPG